MRPGCCWPARACGVGKDNFPLGGPPWERVGVQFVEDVRPYELMKLRLLNASHQALAYFGLLLGHVFVYEATQDPQLVALLSRYMANEATPTLPDVPGVDLADYRQSLVARFANPAIGDTLARLAAFSTDRIPKWLLPVVRENLHAGRSIQLASAVIVELHRSAPRPSGRPALGRTPAGGVAQGHSVVR